jgi:hypothetical protein
LVPRSGFAVAVRPFDIGLIAGCLAALVGFWTPVTLLAVAGIVILLRQGAGARRVADHGYLVALSAMAVGLLGMQLWIVRWDGGWSFSARYLASPLPIYAIGLSGLMACGGPGEARRSLSG